MVYEKMNKLDKNLNIIELSDDINNGFIKPYNNGITVYTKSNCYRCDELKSNISKINNIFSKYYYINCDNYLNDDKDGFKEFMALHMCKRYNKDFKLLFPVVFVDGVYCPKFFLM